MYWMDLAFDCDVPDDRVRQAWAAVFGVAPEAVAIVADMAEESPWADPRVRIGLERRALPGDFPLRLMAVLRGTDVDARVVTREGEITAIRRLCAELDCRALVSIEGIQPWEWLLVAPNGQTTVVEVDEDRLDETGAVILARTAVAPSGG